MSLEPAIALMMGLVVLGQMPGPAAVAGIAFVVVAGVGAGRTGARPTTIANPSAAASHPPDCRCRSERSRPAWPWRRSARLTKGDDCLPAHGGMRGLAGLIPCGSGLIPPQQRGDAVVHPVRAEHGPCVLSRQLVRGAGCADRLTAHKSSNSRSAARFGAFLAHTARHPASLWRTWERSTHRVAGSPKGTVARCPGRGGKTLASSNYDGGQWNSASPPSPTSPPASARSSAWRTSSRRPGSPINWASTSSPSASTTAPTSWSPRPAVALAAIAAQTERHPSVQRRHRALVGRPGPCLPGLRRGRPDLRRARRDHGRARLVHRVLPALRP